MALSFDDNFDKIERAILNACANAADNTAREIATAAKKAVPVDYGALKAIIHVVSADKSEYRDATARALSANRRIDKQIASEYPIEEQERGVIHVAVDAPVEYAVYVEYGTGRTRPQPFLGPAGNNAQSGFEARLKNELRDALD